MSKSLITGYYGMKNYGDDLFSILSFMGIAKYRIALNCKLLCPELKEINGLEYSCLNLFQYGYPYLNKYGAISRLSNVIFSITGKVDNVFFAGGSLYSNSNWGPADLIYKKKNCKFHAMGVSIGPFDNVNTEKKIINDLKKYSYISLRDKASFKRVKSYDLDAKIVLAGDLAGLGVELIEKKEKIINRVMNIGFSPCWIDNDIEKTFKYINNFYSEISKINSIEYKIIILCLNENPSNGDVSLCQHIEKKLVADGVNCTLVYYGALGVIGTWHAINDLDFYYTVRLHGAITAYLTETPFHLYEYHEKCTEFLNYIGHDRSVLRVDSDIESTKLNLLPVGEYLNLSKRNLIEHPLYKG